MIRQLRFLTNRLKIEVVAWFSWAFSSELMIMPSDRWWIP